MSRCLSLAMFPISYPPTHKTGTQLEHTTSLRILAATYDTQRIPVVGNT